jgi:hypothetical protein
MRRLRHYKVMLWVLMFEGLEEHLADEHGTPGTKCRDDSLGV